MITKIYSQNNRVSKDDKVICDEINLKGRHIVDEDM